MDGVLELLLALHVDRVLRLANFGRVRPRLLHLFNLRGQLGNLDLQRLNVRFKGLDGRRGHVDDLLAFLDQLVLLLDRLIAPVGELPVDVRIFRAFLLHLLLKLLDHRDNLNRGMVAASGDRRGGQEGQKRQHDSHGSGR